MSVNTNNSNTTTTSSNSNSNSNKRVNGDLELDTVKSLHMLEDKILGMTGLYTLWTILYISSLISLSVDNEDSRARNFLTLSSGMSCGYTSISSVINIYGNGLPSSMMLIVNPIFLYIYWLLVVYNWGDVYINSPSGIMNIINSVIMGIFSVDMLLKTWLYSLYSSSYRKYVKSM